MNFLRRRRARLLIRRAQPFADGELVAAANFTWIGNSLGAQPGVRGRGDWAGGLADWTLIGAGASRLFVIAANHLRPDKGIELIGSWPLAVVKLREERYDRRWGPSRWALGAQSDSSSRPRTRWDKLSEVALMTTSHGPVEEDVVFVLSYDDDTTISVPPGEGWRR